VIGEARAESMMCVYRNVYVCEALRFTQAHSGKLLIEENKKRAET
jgi:hypothetical protein